MEDIYASLLIFDELPPQERAALADRIQQDPSLAAAFARWREACARIREQFAADLPSCRLLVLYALASGGHDNLLTAHEQELLDEARPEIEQAMTNHPALDDVVTRIQEERDHFDAHWEAHTASVAGSAAPGSETHDSIDGVASASSPHDDDPARRSPADREPRPSSSSTARRRVGWVATSALAVIAVVLAVFLWPREAEQTVVTTAEGEMQRLELVDGSMVRLGPDSELAYRAANAEAFDRRVTLRYGKAFFEVQELKSQVPFRVNTPTATATVVGTTFGMDVTAERTDVVLSDGTVAVNTPDGTSETTVTLAPGQRSRVPRGGRPSEPTSADLTEAFSWAGLLVFRSVPAQEIAAQLSDQFDVSISVAASLQDEPVTGTFDREQPVTAILETVAAALDARVEGTPDSGLRLVSPVSPVSP
jgi:ferric-dicitrate binding protein FerR (iron transport regulator)